MNVSLNEACTLPPVGDPRLDTLEPSPARAGAYPGFLADLTRGIDTAFHMFGDPSGANSARALALQRAKKQTVVLLQLASSAGPGFRWNDQGTLLYSIEARDLAAGRFEDVMVHVF